MLRHAALLSVLLFASGAAADPISAVAQFPGVSFDRARFERAARGWHAVPTSAAHWISAGASELDVTLPFDARGATRIELRGRSDFWLEVRALDVGESVGVPVAGALMFRNAAATLDVVYVAERQRVEELRVLRSSGAPKTARYALELGPGVATLTMREGRIELRDRDGQLRIASAPMFAIDANGVRREVLATLNERTLTTTIDTAGLTYPIVVDPVWAAAGGMKTGRVEHAASVIGDKVLISGGSLAGNEPVSTAEIYDRITNTWTETGAMATKRTRHGSVVLPSGKVLVVGGLSTTSSFSKMSSAELFDPANGTWSAAPSAPNAREFAYTALLSNGKVLVAGHGSKADLYDPDSNTWSSGGALKDPTQGGGQGALLALDNGKVAFFEYKRVHIYDPSTNTWTDGPDYPMERNNCIIAALPDARVLVLGGFGARAAGGFGALNHGDMYSAASNSWIAKTTMSKTRIYGSATLRTPDELLVVGGVADAASEAITVAELLAIKSNTWSAGANTSRARVFHTASLLPTGHVLIAGGAGDTTAPPTNTAELYIPSTSDVAACKDDTTSVGKDGQPQSCLPFRCGANGTCNKECATSAECASGNTCDVASKTCSAAAAPAPSADDGGCAMGRSSRVATGTLLLLSLAALGRLRRRR
jgi:hypothetical protein